MYVSSHICLSLAGVDDSVQLSELLLTFLVMSFSVLGECILHYVNVTKQTGERFMQ